MYRNCRLIPPTIYRRIFRIFRIYGVYSAQLSQQNVHVLCPFGPAVTTCWWLNFIHRKGGGGLAWIESEKRWMDREERQEVIDTLEEYLTAIDPDAMTEDELDRKSTRLNSSHVKIS